MSFEISIDGISEGQPVPSKFAFCAGAEMGDNKSPAITWSGAPDGAQSFVITCIDPDAPTEATDVNVEGRTVPASLPRAEFTHWLLADIPATCSGLDEGADADGIVAKGKPAAGGACGGVRGRNDYTAWFDGDPDMGGSYNGYDGPCPPGNDEIIHHYVYTVHALDTASVGLAGGYDLAALRAAMEGHVLASHSITGTYTLNPALG